MDRSFRFFKKIFKRKSPNGDEVEAHVRSPNDDEVEAHVRSPNDDEVEVEVDVELQWSRLHVSLVHDYLLDISNMGDEYFSRELLRPCEDFFMFTFFYGKKSDSLRELRVIRATKMAYLSEQIRDVFKVLRLNEFLQSLNHSIKRKHQLVEAFISFLLQLLHHKPADSIVDPFKDRIENLEKELGFLSTIHGDISLMLEDEEHEQVQNLLQEFEAVANEAGSLVHSLLFSNDRVYEKMDEDLALVLNHIDLLKTDIMVFLNRWSSTCISTYMITPKTSVVKSFLILNSLIHDLENLMDLEDNPIADVKDQIKTLQQGLIFLQSSIKDDKGSPRPSEIGELKEPLMLIGDMAHQAEYLIISFFFGEAPLWYLINRLTDINRKIQLIGTDVLEIIEKYKIGDFKDAEHFSTHDLKLQAKKKLEVDDVTVGFEEKATHILDQLVGGKKSLQVISIFGMPGIGKTTLAKQLYNHPSVKYWFDKLSWCVISQIFQRKSTMTNILIQLASQLQKDCILQMEEESLVEHIYKTLKGRRYLIVLDDIWDPNVWDDLQRCLPDDGNGSRVLFTTRNKDVAPPNSIIYALSSLTDNQCWELLKKKVFDDRPCPPKLIGIGKKIAANCGGLPLAVVVIAGVLSTMDKEISTWEKVGRNLASYIFDDGDDTMMQILELSYKHLPEYLKSCFLYFGAFEQDKEIRTGYLKMLWIAEGFIHKEVGKTVENIAEEYLKELIDKSLVMVTKRRSDGGAKTCVIHDLLHDLCLKRLKEENFLKFVNNYAKNFRDRDYSTYEKGHRLLALEEYVSSEYHQYVGACYFIKGPISPKFYFRHSRFLKVLHCSCLKSHFIRIENVVCLKYLVITYLRAEIASLVNLEYLFVDTHETVEIPPAILKMKKLRSLYLRSKAIYGRDSCINSYKTNNLEFLSRVVIRGPKDEEKLKLSPHLSKLKLSTLRHVDLSFLTQLESLNVELRGFKMAEISFPSGIRKLTLCGKFRMCWENMSTIGRLEKLEVLKLECCAFVEDERWDTRDGEFQELTFLKLDRVNLTQWNVDSSQHFPKLQRLIFWNCNNLEEIPGEIGEVPTLEMIEVQGRCPESLVESAKSIQQQQLDMGNEELMVIISVER